MDLERGSFYSPPRASTSPAPRALESVVPSGIDSPSMSFSMEGREMKASSAFLVPGQEFSCMDAPNSLVSPEAPSASASPSIGGSPAWVRTSVGAAFLMSTGGNDLLRGASSHLQTPQASPPPSRHRHTRTSPEMLEAFGRSPAPSVGSDEPRSLETSFEAAQATHQGGSRGSPPGLRHQYEPPNLRQNSSQGATGPSQPQRAATPQLRFQSEQNPPQWPADPITLRPGRSPGAEQQQGGDKGGSRGASAEDISYRAGSPARQQVEERRAQDSQDPASGGGFAQRPRREAEGADTVAAAACAALEEELEAMQLYLAETATERDAAVREARELREALAGRAEAMARLEGTLEATEAALASTEERFGRAQESVSGDLSAGRAREQQLRLQLTDAEEKAESRARSLAEAERKINAVEASEEKLLQLIEAQQADIRVLNSKLSDREASFASLKEALIDADSEKHGLGRAVQRARDDTDDMRRANRVLQRSIEGQEKEIEELKAALSHSKEELRELQRRNHWLECQQQGPPSGGGAGLRGSLQQLQLEPRSASASLRSSLDAERLSRDGPSLAPRPMPMQPAREEEWVSSRPGTSQGHRPPVPSRPSSSLSQDDLGVLKHLMGKVKAAKGSGSIDPNNPPGLSPEEGQIFKYLWDKMKEGEGPGEGGEAGAALPSSRPPEPHYEYSHQSSAEPTAHDLPPRRFANRPAPFATGAGYNGEWPPGSDGRPGVAPREQQVEATPFGTDRTLQSTELSTKDLEERLLSLNQEKDSLDSEYSRMPLNALRTQAQRERKAAVEERLDKLTSEISSCKRQIKKAGAM